ncbi:VOC family protein [Hahella aquimaris]|uniref:VOC family protein n=1 Tax=Hahella sp. HNIBRBA332 TaxID=3015983 RepID=UPI00273C07E4|nr:VOC family protein [Hahella sp. HNIBRBA332]WLQ11606.1 VOC family protein [Hahella sp. HNIBRBA332]
MTTGWESMSKLMLRHKAKKIDHVAIAVLDLEQAIGYFSMMGFTLSDRMTTTGAHSAMHSAVMEAGPIKFVLLEGANEASQITRFINEYGPGPQHIAIEVEDVESLCKELETQGLDFSTKTIKGPDLIQRFTVRCPNSGVMIEFIERNEEEGFSEQNVEDLFRQLEASDAY